MYFNAEIEIRNMLQSAVCYFNVGIDILSMLQMSCFKHQLNEYICPRSFLR